MLRLGNGLWAVLQLRPIRKGLESHKRGGGLPAALPSSCRHSLANSALVQPPPYHQFLSPGPAPSH